MIKLPWRVSDLAGKINSGDGNIDSPERSEELPSANSMEGDNSSDTDTVLMTDSANKDLEMCLRIFGYEVVNIEFCSKACSWTLSLS